MSKKTVKTGRGSRVLNSQSPLPTHAPEGGNRVVTTPELTTEGADAASDPNWPLDLKTRLGRLGKVGMEVTVELGRTSLSLEQILNLGPGHLVELEKSAVAPVDVRVNGVPFGRGEIIALGDSVAVRMTELLKPDQMQNV